MAVKQSTLKSKSNNSFGGFVSAIRALLAAFLVTGLALSAPVGVRAATLTVDTIVDENDHDCSDGDCSLRDALELAVAGDTIQFSTTVFPTSSPKTIALTSPLPAITVDHLTLDASNAGVILDGSALTAGNGLSIDNADYVTIKGLQILHFPDNGISLQNSTTYATIGGTNGTPEGSCSGDCNLISGNDTGILISGSDVMSATISGNYIGTNVAGTAVLSNTAYGIFISESSYALIGGDTAGERNLISGNGHGITLSGSNAVSNTISGNYIGTNVSGTADLGNVSDGIWIGESASHTLIGGTTTGEGNLISGNGNNGIVLHHSPEGVGVAYTTISGNTIGTNAAGTAVLGNANDGIAVIDSSYTLIGGDTAGERNLISGNGSRGISISGTATHNAIGNTISGNTIGTTRNGTGALGNSEGVVIDDESSATVIGGSNTTPGGSCTGECNLISGNNGNGISINDSKTVSTTISGNYIGTTANGKAALGNGSEGIAIGNGSSYNLVGGNTGEQRNLISGNGGNGISISSDETETLHLHNTVSGNYVGTDVSGTAALPNGNSGIYVGSRTSTIFIGGSNATPGGACTGECNLISGNQGDGIIFGNTMSSTISGNYIGTNISGTVALSNEGDGIWLGDEAQHNLIGGDESGEGNLISGNALQGINLHHNPDASSVLHNAISGNTIGTNAAGTADLGNGENGIYIGDGSYNVIGGTTAGERNLISGNDATGIFIEGSTAVSNTISGNYIGTTLDGSATISNTRQGIYINNSPATRIGGSNATPSGNCTGACNLISGNGEDGIAVSGSDALSTTISGNYLGTTLDGDTILGNGSAGVSLFGNSAYTRIGGSTPAQRNVIGGSTYQGIFIYERSSYNTLSGNAIGVGADGAAAIGNLGVGVLIDDGSAHNLVSDNLIANNGSVGIGVHGSDALYNTLSQNRIYDNAEGGIDLSDGGNMELFPPLLAEVSTTHIQGLAPAYSTIEVFSDDGDEGRYFHGTTTADASGEFTFSQASPFTGTNVTATTTDGDGNTSEFAEAQKPSTDAQVMLIFQPGSVNHVGQTITPTVKVGNGGTTPQTIQVSVTATGAPVGSYADTQNVTLPPLGLITLAFEPFTPDTTGSYVFTATATLAGDEDLDNNTLTQDVVVNDTHVDVWTKDYAEDTGNVPSKSWWQSPDIWVRNQDDGLTNQTHQDPIAGETNYVYVRVRNRGDATAANTTVKVYWHEPSLGIACGSWAYIGQQTVASLAPGGTQVIKVAWTPTRTGHTCLFDVLESVQDPVTEQCDVAWDNNIEQRNVDIIAGGEGVSTQALGGITFEVTNIKDKPKPLDLIIDVSTIPDAGAVSLDLGSELAARWAAVNGAAKSRGIAWNGGSLITVTHSISGTIASIPMAGSETRTVTLLVDAPSVMTATVSVYAAIDADAMPLADAIIGGNTYLFTTPETRIYLPLVLRNKS